MAKTSRNGVYRSPLEQMRRQLGAANAREHALKQRIRDLEQENERLTAIGAKYRTRCEDLERLCRDMFSVCGFAMQDEFVYRMDALGLFKEEKEVHDA